MYQFVGRRLGKDPLIFVVQDCCQFRRICSGCADIIYEYSTQMYMYVCVHVGYIYRVSKQFLCTCAKMVRHCAGSGEVSYANPCRLSGICNFFHMSLGDHSRSAFCNEVLYIHFDFHSNIYCTSDRCTGNIASPIYRP